MAKKSIKKEEVVKETKQSSIPVEIGNIEPIKIQFLQAINNQLGIIIELLKEIKDK